MQRFCCLLLMLSAFWSVAKENSVLVKVKGLNDPAFMFYTEKLAENFEVKMRLLFNDLGCEQFTSVRDVVFFEFDLPVVDKASEASVPVTDRKTMYSFRRIQALCDKNHAIDLYPSSFFSFRSNSVGFDFVATLDGNSFVYDDIKGQWTVVDLGAL